MSILDLQVVAYDYPTLTLDIQCGSGTYVRSLGRDIAKALGTAAVMSALERTAIGDFTVTRSTAMNALDAKTLPEHLIPAINAVPQLPRITLADDDLRKVRNGGFIENRFDVTGDEIAGCDENGALCCLLAVQGGQLRPLRNFG